MPANEPEPAPKIRFRRVAVAAAVCVAAAGGALSPVPAQQAAEPKALAIGTVVRDCDDCPDMVLLPAGSFRMGSPEDEADRVYDEGPQRAVRFAAPLFVSRTEITFAQWQACVAGGGCADNPQPGDNGWGRGNRPVIGLNYGDAMSYAAWLSAKTGKPYRLLSEAEWEYAARAGTTTRFHWGDGFGGGEANCDGCGSEWDNEKTAPVASVAPNAFGLHDMPGNTWEWTSDCYRPSYKGAPRSAEPRTAANCRKRVVRGGAWNDDPTYLRSATRNWQRPTRRDKYNGGVRVARPAVQADAR